MTELDPLAAVQAAAVEVQTTPAETYQPPPTPETPNPDPVAIPASTRLVPNLDALPAILKSADGPWLDLPAAVAVLWQIFHSLEVRTVAGQVVLTAKPASVTGPVWSPGTTAEVPVTWDEPAPIVPTGDDVNIEAGVAWMGRISARVKPGSVTTTGCVILATAVGAAPVVPSAGQPVALTAKGLYLHTPALDLEQ